MRVSTVLFNIIINFFQEKVEYERLKLEEQISMLEKVIEQGIKQTTELQEIHHSEVEDLHKQVKIYSLRSIC